MSEINKTYNWDDMITDDGAENRETVVLPEGNYPFSVVKVEKAYYDGNGTTMPGCNLAKVYLRLDGGSLGEGFTCENIYLLSKFEWKASAFLRAVGQKKHGEPVSWAAIPNSTGLTGRCRVKVDTYTANGEERKANRVDKFFDKDEQQSQKAYTKGAF